MMNILILNSAQGKCPLGSDTWVRGTVRAIESLAGRRDIRLVCSADPHPWNLVTYLAGKLQIPSLAVMTESESMAGQHTLRDFMASYVLDDRLTTVRWLDRDCAGRMKQRWQERDSLAFASADIIYPVSIRRGGRLDNSLPAVVGKARDAFRIPWKREGYLPEYHLADRKVIPFPKGDWLVHWTRACPGPWPGETAAAYYHDMLAHPERYVRSAGNTLARMLQESRIRASSWRMPGGKAAVSFSANGPGDAMRLMRWRKRYVRYSFEPWGIAVERRTLEEMGARQVRYDGGSNDGERLFTQSSGSAGDWEPEAEWRLPGDCDLHSIPAGRMFAVVPDNASATRLTGRYPAVRCHPIFAD